MFSKIKSRKAPLSLSSVSNAIKTAGNQDLSPIDIHSKNLDVSIITQLGLPKNSILAVAYDPIQSLLAISTTTNEIRVYGQQNVEVVFEFKSTSPITHLSFVKGVYLVAVAASSGNVTVLSLHTKQIMGTFSTSSAVHSVATDPALDWLVLGLTNGALIFYDVDRINQTPFRIDNLQKKILPKSKLSPVLSVEWHPRDIGTLLITYSHCAVIYSLASGDITQSFVYSVPKGARGYDLAQYVDNGGKKKMFGGSNNVLNEVTEAHYHPNGLHVVTVHKDSTLVFWDANDGTLLEARTAFETHLHLPGPPVPIPDAGLFQTSNVQWICGQDPELTQLVIAGAVNPQPFGKSGKAPTENFSPGNNGILHVLDFGYTFKYSMTSHQKQGEFYSQPQGGQKIIPVAFNESSGSSGQFEFIERIYGLPIDSSPYFGGFHNPKYLLLLSNLGSVYFLRFDISGSSVAAGGGSLQGSTDLGDLLLPTSIGYVHPPVSFSSVNSIKRVDWYSILSTRAATGAGSVNKNLLHGGSPVGHQGDARSIGNSDGSRDILITGHENGLIRLLDISRGEANEQANIVQISLKETLFDNGDSRTTKITHVSCSFESRELFVGLGNGDAVICKFGKRKTPPGQANSNGLDYSKCQLQHSNGNAKILNISDRVSGTFSQSVTFLPTSLLQTEGNDEITCLKLSNIGFGAVGYKSGRLVVCDITRGPAIILNIDSITQHLVSVTGPCHPTTFEFSIMEYGQEGFSSILLFVGTNCGGNLVTFKILPQSNGGFEVVFADKTLGLNYRSMGGEDQTVSKLDKIIPISSKNGASTIATLDTFRKLSQGILIPGFVITTSPRDLRVLKLPRNKLSHKVIDEVCVTSGVIEIGNKVVLASVVKSGFIKFSSLPALNDIAEIKFSKEIYLKLKDALSTEVSKQSDILPSGNFFIRSSDTEAINLRAFLKDSKLKLNKNPPTDLLFNENAIIPPRPSAGALSWAKGQTKYISVEDLAILIAGPNRKPPKFDESRLAHNISPEANPQQGYGGYLANQHSPDAPNDRGYKDPVRKNVQAGGRFGGAGFMRSLQSGLENVEETIGGYANNMSEQMTESIEGGKRSFYGAALKSKVGL